MRGRQHFLGGVVELGCDEAQHYVGWLHRMAPRYLEGLDRILVSTTNVSQGVGGNRDAELDRHEASSKAIIV